jgi:hypothetical protein
VVQERLGDIARIITAAELLGGEQGRAIVWFKHQPLAGSMDKPPRNWSPPATATPFSLISTSCARALRVTAKRVGRFRSLAAIGESLAPKWAHDPLNGAGRNCAADGSNSPACQLYMSEEFSTAVAEYEQDLGIRPGTLCAYDVKRADRRPRRHANPSDIDIDTAALRAP